MRVLSQGRLARRIAQALLAAFLWSTVLMGAGAVPASAQISTRATTAQSIAVVPFVNRTTYQPETLGATARALVSDELETRLLLSVESSKDVDEAIQELGLKVPLTEAELIRLATEIEVPMVVTGVVGKAEVVMADGQRYAEVTLSLALFDRAAAAVVNGATVTAKSPASADASAEEMMDKALKQAVFAAVNDMKTRPTITATVLWAKGSEIFTNAGTRGGIAPGMRMVAIRGGQRIAVVEITSAESTGSYGKVVEGSTLQTGDYLRAVYEIKPTERPLLAKKVRREGSRLEQVALAAGILLGLGSFVSDAKSVAEGVTAAAGLRAADVANGWEMGLSGLHQFIVATPWWVPDPEDPTQGEFVVFFSAADDYPAATMITWQPPSGSEAARIAGFLVRRDGHPVGVAFPTHDENWVIDSWAPPPGQLGAEVTIVTLDVNTVTGGISVGRVTDAWDPDISIDQDGVITFNPEYNDWVTSLIPAGGVMNGVGFSATHIPIAWQVVGPYPPTMSPWGTGIYEYTVQPFVIENRGTGPNPQWEFKQNFWQFAANKRVESVLPPDNKLQTVMLSNTALSVGLYGPKGADEMIVQVTRDRGPGQPIRFSNVASRVQSGFNPTAADISMSAAIPIDELRALPGDTNVYWLRIGGRNRSSETMPLAYPITAELDSGDPRHDDSGWVWWDANPMRLVDTAAPAKAASMKRDRDVLTDSRTGRTRIHNPRSDREMHVPRR